MVKIRLKTSIGKYLTSDGATETVPLNATRSDGGEMEEFWLTTTSQRILTNDQGTLRTSRFLDTANDDRNSAPDRYVTTVDSRGRSRDRLFVRDRFLGDTNDDFTITRLNRSGEELADGDRIALKFTQTLHPGFLSADSSGLLRLIDRESPGPEEIFTVETTSELKLFWSSQRADNFSTATSRGMLDALQAGYTLVRAQGRIYMNPTPGCRRAYLFWHSGYADNLLTATEEGEKAALDAGYAKVRIEGYVRSKPEPGTIPLRMYWRGAERNDSFTTTSIKEEQDAADALYEFVRDEGHVTPSLTLVTEVQVDTPVLRPDAPVIRPGEAGVRVNPEDLINVGPGIGRGLIPEAVIRVTFPRRRRQTNKKALILSGGGAKGCFEVGAAKRLWEQNWLPDIICGVSVGALNAAKLAEKRNVSATDSSATDLEAIWQQFNPTNLGGRAVYSKDYFADLLLKWIPKMLEDGIDDAVGGTNIINWFMYAATHLHAIHSMHPLRGLIHRNLNLNAIRAGGAQLRIGITDLKTGQYFSVTEPFEAAALGLNHCGRIELEPDHRMGETWLTRPIFGANAYAMSIEDAIYSSSVLPVYMDPKILNLRNTQSIPYRGERIALLKASRSGFEATYSPSAIERIMQTSRNGERSIDGGFFTDLKNSQSPPYDLGQILRESDNIKRGDSRQAQYPLFDGGLRDTMAIRTAIRLGAREIIVITGDRLQAAQWNFKNPGTINNDAFALPVAQYLFGLLGVWFNETARTDVMLAIAQNEFLGWLYRCYSLMEEPKRQQILAEFNEYWSRHGPTLQHVLGGSTWIGGDVEKAYGVPFQDEGCSINYIAPQGDLVDALGFDKWNEIQEGIQMGYEAAKTPTELSFPVPDRILG